MKCFQGFVDEAIRYKRVRELKAPDSTVNEAANYTGKRAREGKAIKRISGVGAGECGKSVKLKRMPENRRIVWRRSSSRTPQSNGNLTSNSTTDKDRTQQSGESGGMEKTTGCGIR